MSSHRMLAVALAGAFAVAPAAAQAQDGEFSDRNFVVRFQGGGFSPIEELDPDGLVKFDTGWSVGGGIGVPLTRHLALRGNVAFARSELQDFRDVRPRNSFNGIGFNRFFYDADLQWLFPFRSGFAPYVFAGGGVVNVDVRDDENGNPPLALDGDGNDDFTKGAGKFGVGISYRPPDTPIELYLQGTGWVYKWDRLGFDKTQIDTTWGGGVGFRF